MNSWWDRALQTTPQQRQVPQPVHTGWAPPSVPAHPQQVQPGQAQGSVTPENFIEMAGQWAGGDGARETQRCPQCGSNHYFSRAPKGPSRMPPPAPLCYSCGYNGLHDQGDPTTWGATG